MRSSTRFFKGFVGAVASLTFFCFSTASAGFTAHFSGTVTGRGAAGQYQWFQKEYAESGLAPSGYDYDPGYVETSVSFVNPSGSNNNYWKHNFVTFCLQSNVTLLSNPHTYNVVNLDLAPDSPSAAMGTIIANKIRKMWKEYRDDLDTGSVDDQRNKSAAFQWTIWNLLGQVGNTVSGFGIGSENYAAVQGYFNTYKTEANWVSGMANLYAITGGGADQDQVFEFEPDTGITEVVPVPPAIGLVLVGMATGLFLRRRLTGNKLTPAIA